jgi:hypothetical protein
MPIQRSKVASAHGNVDIHDLVEDWWQDVEISYVAHAFLRNGEIVRLRPKISARANNSPASHPDQAYWRNLDKNKARAVPAILNAVDSIRANVVRIEIDCKLMPCNERQTGCLYQVPALMVKYYKLSGIPLRIFSHADEHMGGSGTGHPSTKRVITCTTGDTEGALTIAYSNHDGWGWVP